MTKRLLHAQNIRKAFTHPVKMEILRGVDLSVSEGESVAIIGRSGEGKSTLLQILGTLEEPSHGTLHLNGIQVNALNRPRLRNQSIGFVFQSFHLLDDYTALENVLMPARIARQDVTKGSVAYVRGITLLEEVGLGHRAFHPAKLLSGGEKQRVALARAVCNDPQIIFADEPSGNLDGTTAQMIHSYLFRFSKEQGKALVLVTHDPALAALCSTQYELSNGILQRSPSAS